LARFLNPQVWVPLLLNLRERSVIVFGGGIVATRRVESLVRSCGRVVVVSTDFTPRLERLAARYPHLSLVRRQIDPDVGLGECMGDAYLVIVATDNFQLNSRIAVAAKSAKKLVNRVDSPEDSDVIFPSTARKGDVTIAISTGGKSPLVAKQLRQRLAGAITKTDVGMTSLLDFSRRLALRELGEERVRSRVLKRIASDRTIRNMLDRGSLRQAKTRAKSIIMGYK